MSEQAEGQRIERNYWEANIKGEAIRAGIDPSGTVGRATLHLIGEEVERLREMEGNWLAADNLLNETAVLLRKCQAEREKLRAERDMAYRRLDALGDSA